MHFQGDLFCSQATWSVHLSPIGEKILCWSVESVMVNIYKVVLCGKTGVGKTSIFQRMCGSKGTLKSGKAVQKTMMNHERQVIVKIDDSDDTVQVWLYQGKLVIILYVLAKIGFEKFFNFSFAFELTIMDGSFVMRRKRWIGWCSFIMPAPPS